MPTISGFCWTMPTRRRVFQKLDINLTSNINSETIFESYIRHKYCYKSKLSELIISKICNESTTLSTIRG
jgi:hypothetical protein